MTVVAPALATAAQLADADGVIEMKDPTFTPAYEAAMRGLPFIRTAFNYDRDAASLETGLACPEPTKAQQQFRDDSDINVIVKRFGLTGELPNNVRMPTYEDFTGVVTDFHTAANAVRAAEEAFATMPADVRTRFNNDPGAFVDFCSDEKNRAEAERLGLVHPKKGPPGPNADLPAGSAPETGTPPRQGIRKRPTGRFFMVPPGRTFLSPAQLST